MTIDVQNLMQSIMDSMDRIEYIKAEDIPDIDLYMDQVTTFMDSRLKNTTRHPDEDKVLTKTMINNYAKNDLLPPPIKKKYSKEHVLLLIFIYYYKGLLSINDIQTLLSPITKDFFGKEGQMDLAAVYEEIFRLEKPEVERMKQDVLAKFETAQKTFADVDDEKRQELQLFTFIGLLGFDVYVKKLMIEKVLDGYRELTGEEKKPEKEKK
ncbi:MAG: DUF1836 domain-containing protein [Lachnospiraceae bacterium]|nr:DUF1836 domain-containing protein [Lachnospiraceae bacterium]